MDSPVNRSGLRRIEVLTLLLLGAIALVVLLPKYRQKTSESTPPGQSRSKHGAAFP